MNPSLSVHLVDMVVGMILFSWYTSSPLLYSNHNVNSVADKPIGLVEGRGCQHGC